MKHLQAFALAGALLLGLAGCAAPDASSEPASQAAATAAPPASPAPEPTPEPVVCDPLTGQETGINYANVRPVAVTLRNGAGSGPYWGLAAADVLLTGVSEGYTATTTALYASADEIAKAGPVGAGRDLTLQLALPLNALPVHIDKNVYAANLLNLLSFRDLDGYHIGKVAFAHDDERRAAGYHEEDCWYTNGELIRAGLAQYGASLEGANQPLFAFGAREAPAAQNAVDLSVVFSGDDTQRLLYDAGSGLYSLCSAIGDPVTDGATGEAVTFTNVFVLYASSGIKDDTYTRQYDLSGGTGLYLTGGGWEPIQWSKGDATAPLVLHDAQGETLNVAPGKSYLAVWGGYYGQGLRLLGADGAEQALPEKPALLESGVSDEDAAAAEEAYRREHAILDAWAALDAANAQLTEAQQLLTEAQSTPDTNDDDNAAYLAALAQQAIDTAKETLRGLGLDPEAGRDAQPAADPAAAQADAAAQAGADTPAPADPAAPDTPVEPAPEAGQ